MVQCQWGHRLTVGRRGRTRKSLFDSGCLHIQPALCGLFHAYTLRTAYRRRRQRRAVAENRAIIERARREWQRRDVEIGEE